MRFAILILLLCGCQRDRDATLVLGGSAMGTTWSLRSEAGSSTARPLSQAALQRQFDTWEAILSHWRPDSALSHFNNATETGWIAVPQELVEVVELAREIGHETGGALDITLAPLVDLWGFGSGERRGTAPSEAGITAARAECGWRHLESRLHPPALRKKRPGLRINVSAVAEGWALDQIAKQLEASGHSRFLIELGGEVLARGEWRVGIQNPAAPPGQPAQTLRLRDHALATSGVYRQSFESGGQQHAHILDPRSGHPVRHRLASVSVIHPRAALADGYATALLVLGPEEGRRLAEKLRLQVVWFERENGLGK